MQALTEGDRRLAAIMFTDMVGYTALSQKDEGYSLQLLKEQRKLVRPFLPKHSGREVKTFGDAFLVEFASALEAVRCAFDIQQALHELNSGRPPESRVLLRIGVHLGDVIHSQNDVYGDDVNVASRIEPLAEPGGICITRQVYDHIKNKFEFPLSSLGKKELKNISEPTEVFRVILPWQKEVAVSPGFDVHRLAVLPLANISPDPKDSYFADGMTEELITVLSQLEGLRVIARTSVDHYAAREKRVSQIAQELQVGSVMEGSVRMAKDRIRVTVQLINTTNEEHVWSENYDRRLDDIFEIQSDIAQQVARSLKVKLLGKERERSIARPTENISAYVNYLKGRSLLSRRRGNEIKQARELFESTIVADANYAPAYSGLADAYFLSGDYFVLPVHLARQKAKEFVLKALQLDPDLAEAHASLGLILDAEYEFAQAENEYKMAIALNPSYANAHHWRALSLVSLGRYQEAIKELRLAEEADPLSVTILGLEVLWFGILGMREEAARKLEKAIEIDPDHLFVINVHGTYYYLRRDYQRAIRILSDGLKMARDPNNPMFKADLALAYAASDDRTNAIRWLRELRSIPEETAGRSQSIAYVYAALGEIDDFFVFANRAFKEKTLNFGDFRLIDRIIPGTRKIRDDPRFSELFRKANLELQADID